MTRSSCPDCRERLRRSPSGAKARTARLAAAEWGLSGSPRSGRGGFGAKPHLIMENPWPRIGWRNLARHRKRTVLTALGLAVGYFAVIFMIGWAEGLTAEMVENATGLVSGQIEIHDDEYRPERSLYDTIGGRDGTDIARLLDGVAADAGVVAVAPRVYAAGLVSSGESTSAGMLMGIDPTRERTVSRFLDELVDGELPESGRNQVAVGVEMARQLEVGIGDEVVVVAPGADGSMGNDLYTVAAIFRTGIVELDAAQAVMPLADLQTLITLDAGRIHEIAVATDGPWVADDTAGRLVSALAPGDLAVEVASWTELNPVILDFVVLIRFLLFPRLRDRFRHRHLWRGQHDADGDVRASARDRRHAGARRQAPLDRQDRALRGGGDGRRRLGLRVGDQPAAHVLVERRPT